MFFFFLSTISSFSQIDFMRKFGYLEAGNPSAAETLYTEDVIREALKDVQKFGGLKETGILDKRTRAVRKRTYRATATMNVEKHHGNGNHGFIKGKTSFPWLVFHGTMEKGHFQGTMENQL